jgi:hypothetical protein
MSISGRCPPCRGADLIVIVHADSLGFVPGQRRCFDVLHETDSTLAPKQRADRSWVKVTSARQCARLAGNYSFSMAT